MTPISPVPRRHSPRGRQAIRTKSAWMRDSSITSRRSSSGHRDGEALAHHRANAHDQVIVTRWDAVSDRRVTARKAHRRGVLVDLAGRQINDVERRRQGGLESGRRLRLFGLHEQANEHTEFEMNWLVAVVAQDRCSRSRSPRPDHHQHTPTRSEVGQLSLAIADIATRTLRPLLGNRLTPTCQRSGADAAT